MTEGNDRALLSMTRFQCIGPRCEDHCCGSWSIGMDRSTHDALARAYGALGKEVPPFASRVSLVTTSSAVSKGSFATMNHSADGNCTFLRPDGWCDVHARFGGTLLPTVCASYPRRFTPSHRGLEIGGSLSCPEVARLTLLSEDGAEVVAFDGGPGLRAMQWTEAPIPEGPYTAPELEVQGALAALLAFPRYDIGARLFCLAWLGQSTSSWFNTSSDPDAPARMRETLRAILVQSTLDDLVERFRELPASTALPIKLITEVLVMRATARMDQLTTGFADFVLRVFSSYLWPDEADATPRTLEELVENLSLAPTRDEVAHADGSAPTGLERLMEGYGARHSSLPEPLVARIDTILERYCRTHVYQNPYRKAKDLAHNLLDMLIRAVVVRFLVVGHPRLQPARVRPAAPPGPTLDDVDAAAVEVIYRMSRLTEHFPGFQGWFRQYLEAEGALGLAHQALLAAFHSHEHHA